MAAPDPELLAALSDLDEVEREIARLTADREAIRARVSELLALRHGSKLAIAGYGVLAIRAPSVARIWDGGALTELIQSLRETGQADIADEVDRCRKLQHRPGGLSIRRERPDEPGGEPDSA